MTITTYSPDQTKQAGGEVGKGLVPFLPDCACVLLLSGELGAGKTTFTQGLAEFLGGESEAVSPSFMYIREQVFHVKHIRGKLIHCDFWRLSADNLSHLDLEKYLQPNHVIVIEWWEKFTEELTQLLSTHMCLIQQIQLLELDETTREIVITPQT